MTEPTSGSALLNVLVVEDDRHIAAIIEVSLRLDPGIAVQVVDTGTDAIETLIHGVMTFDLILLDGTLPDMSGQQLAQIIARHPRLATVPIIILTAALSTEKLDAYRATGVLAVMTKPFDPLTLARDLRSRIEHGMGRPGPIV
ncbi:response regulator [Sphingomonas sp. UYP23]